jgi:hypothetical protein
MPGISAVAERSLSRHARHQVMLALMTPASEALLEQALKLPDEERSEFATRLLRSLEREEGDEPDAQAWEAGWAVELDRRIHEIRGGSVELVDGDEVLGELRAIAERP